MTVKKRIKISASQRRADDYVRVYGEKTGHLPPYIPDDKILRKFDKLNLNPAEMVDTDLIKKIKTKKPKKSKSLP